jgi:hypothetical protein
MFDSTQVIKSTGGYDRILFIGLMATLCLALMFSMSVAQTPTPQPASTNVVTWGGYNVTSVTEVGYRWRRVSGNDNKYRSDLDYRQGLRLFDTNLYLQSDSGKGKYFDTLLLTNSGWGSDPQGYSRFNIEKIGIYKFNANVRKISYFNNLSNHALGEHTSDTRNLMGDFDLTILPQNDKLRFNFGASFGDYSGPGVYTVRAYSDEYPVTNHTKNQTDDFRVGVDGMLLGFNLGLTQGFRIFHDRSGYTLDAPNAGNNPTNTAALATFTRDFPTDGNAYYTQFNAHRTFAKKLDFTGRVIYTSTDSHMGMTERITGRDNSNNVVDLDLFNITALAKRTQTRGDFGLTYLATEKLRISNTFSFDKFSVNGGDALYEAQDRHSATGTVLPTVYARTQAYRVTDYERYINTVEGDYQINNAVAFHIGYRYTHRKVTVFGYDQNLLSTSNPLPVYLGNVPESNGTNAFIGGMKIKPVKNWVVFWDVEHGSADNVFTRLENYKFTNFRVRSRVTMKTLGFNLSYITKDNTNPTQTVDTPVLDFGTVIRSRVFSGSGDWTPMDKLQFSIGYTYRHQNSDTAIRVPIGLTLPAVGVSQFFVRDHYAYFDVSARPMSRMSIYASWRISRDFGQGDRYSPVVYNIITSYPMQFTSPEVRVAFKITRNIDWNVGWQYYNYHDAQTPSLNYKANLPYTSLRFYFGGGTADR